MRISSQCIGTVCAHDRGGSLPRSQLAVNVDDVDAAVDFYSDLFGIEPAKRRPGYANFAITESPLKLVLLQNPGQGGTMNHLGIDATDTVAAEQRRLAAVGLASLDERGTTCCYATRDKFWVDGQSGRGTLVDLHRSRRQPHRRSCRPT